MAVKLPDLAPIDYTALDFDSIIDLVDTLVREHPDYFTNVDDFLQSNAGKFVVELVAYVVDLLANRVDWVANENTLPTSTQKQNVINLLKLINYRLSLPRTATTTVTASISRWVSPFVIPPRYTVPAKDLDGNNINFEFLNKNDDGKYAYEGSGSNYEFNSGFEVSPVLSHNNLTFYEGNSYQEFFVMLGENNETIQLGRINVEEGSIRVWKITRDVNGNIITRKELTQTNSFISPEAQAASDLFLPPYKIQITENNGAYIVFGETPVVAIFAQTGTDEIMTWYRITKGSLGNITTNSINYTTSILAGGENVQISFLNTTAASGGAESESIENAKRYAPLTITTVEKTVNPDDFVVLLESFENVLNAIAYGKSNEPSEILTDYGYRIPPYESWIYTVYNKSGWESFPSYSYPVEMSIGRPYVTYGLRDSENIIFTGGSNEVVLTKLKLNAMDADTANIKVTDTINSVVYTPGDDFVIDLDARTITRIASGAIPESSVVKVQYYENANIDENYIIINFATSDTQDIPRTPVYPGIRSSAVLSNFSINLTENNLSDNDYNWPTGDYYIDYENGKIIRNSAQPYLDSRTTFGTTSDLISNVNNEFIISFEGLNSPPYNSDHDFNLNTLNAWARVGNGLNITYTAATYSFKIAINGSGLREYYFTMGSGGTWTVAQLAEQIWFSAVEVSTLSPFYNSGVVIFADSLSYPTSSSPALTFMSLVEGVTSSVELDVGTTYTDLFSISVNLSLASNYYTGTGEAINILELAIRCRATLNLLGLCTGFAGQELAAGQEEKPEIYSKADLLNLTTFTLTNAITDSLTFELAGTAGTTYDGLQSITFTTVVANSPYNLTTWQGKLDLIKDLQTDVDNALAQDIILVFLLRQSSSHYRIGFRLVDTAGTISPLIKMKDDTARSLLQFSIDQSSLDGNLVEAKVSPNSDMVGNYFLRIQLTGAFGSSALIQCKANNALHNNTLEFLGFSDDQYQRGTNILQRTIIGNAILISNAAFKYEFISSGVNQNNRLCLTITSPPLGFGGDGDYVITIPAAIYNITQLVEAINTAFTTADFSGTPYDISNFMVCEKVESQERIRIRMTDFESQLDFVISDNDDVTINTKCANKLGFDMGQTASTYSTIILSYAGDWNSNFETDTSEEASILKYLETKRLISQDYLIKDAVFSNFDFKAIVYVSKGFDRDLVKDQVDKSVFDKFRIGTREFASPVAASNILKLISDVEGVQYTTLDYFGIDYQLYANYLNGSKAAVIRATDDTKAESVAARWNAKSAFKITLDGTSLGGGNNPDGTYLILVGNTWTSGNYDSLLSAIQNGITGVGGFAQAVPLELGKAVVNLNTVIHVRHYDGVFEIYSENESSRVLIKLEDPDDIQLNGYQAFTRNTSVLQSEYTASSTYSFRLTIDGGSTVNYEITSPTSGSWNLATIADLIQDEIPSSAVCGIDATGYIRITSLLGGYQSTVVVIAGLTGINLLTLLNGMQTPVNGSAGYTSCLSSLKIDPGEARGLETEPPTLRAEAVADPGAGQTYDFYNNKTTITTKYNEILSINDNSFIGGSTELESQRHGLIIEYVEAGA